MNSKYYDNMSVSYMQVLEGEDEIFKLDRKIEFDIHRGIFSQHHNSW